MVRDCHETAELRLDWIGVGLGGMRERAGHFGGDFRVSNANPGTLVEVATPLSVQNRKTKQITQSLLTVGSDYVITGSA